MRSLLLIALFLFLPLAAAAQGLRADFNTVDTDANGVIDRDEFERFTRSRTSERTGGGAGASAGASASASSQFRQLDRNRDGYLSDGELWSMPVPAGGGWVSMDRNGDRRIEPSEFTPIR